MEELMKKLDKWFKGEGYYFIGGHVDDNGILKIFNNM